MPHRSAVRVFQGLGEPTRLRIAALLAATGARACVCELSDALDEPVYKVSRHLNVLEGAGLLASTREGRWMYYAFTHPAPLGGALKATLTGLGDSVGQLAGDRQRFAARLALREGGRCVVWKLDPGQLGRPRTTRQRTAGKVRRRTSQVAALVR